MAEESTEEQSDHVNLVTVTQTGWEKLIGDSELPIVVNFWSSSCANSEKLASTFELLSHRFIGRMKFARVNMEQNKDFVAQFGIHSTPTLIYFYQGRSYFSVIGDAPKHQLESEMNHIVAQPKRCLNRSTPWSG